MKLAANIMLLIAAATIFLGIRKNDGPSPKAALVLKERNMVVINTPIDDVSVSAAQSELVEKSQHLGQMSLFISFSTPPVALYQQVCVWWRLSKD